MPGASDRFSITWLEGGFRPPSGLWGSIPSSLERQRSGRAARRALTTCAVDLPARTARTAERLVAMFISTSRRGVRGAPESACSTTKPWIDSNTRACSNNRGTASAEGVNFRAMVGTLTRDRPARRLRACRYPPRRGACATTGPCAPRMWTSAPPDIRSGHGRRLAVASSWSRPATGPGEDTWSTSGHSRPREWTASTSDPRTPLSLGLGRATAGATAERTRPRRGRSRGWRQACAAAGHSSPAMPSTAAARMGRAAFSRRARLPVVTMGPSKRPMFRGRG